MKKKGVDTNKFRWAYCEECWRRWAASQGTSRCPHCGSRQVEVGEPQEPVFKVPAQDDEVLTE